MRAQHLYRLVPLAGWVSNRLRYPGLHCGLRVEIDGPGTFRFGRGVSLGEGTRIELPATGTLAIGDGVMVSRGVHLVPAAGARIEIGAGTTIQDGCRLYGDVRVGQRCIFAPNAFVSSGTHVFDALPHLTIQEQEQVAPATQRPIRIHGDCWFGINVVIAPGVTVGRGCVVGANSVVTGDLPPYQVAAGNPARILRQRLEFAPKSRIDAANEHDAPYFYDGFDLTRPAGDAREQRHLGCRRRLHAGARSSQSAHAAHRGVRRRQDWVCGRVAAVRRKRARGRVRRCPARRDAAVSAASCGWPLSGALGGIESEPRDENTLHPPHRVDGRLLDSAAGRRPRPPGADRRVLRAVPGIRRLSRGDRGRHHVHFQPVLGVRHRGGRAPGAGPRTRRRCGVLANQQPAAVAGRPRRRGVRVRSDRHAVSRDADRRCRIRARRSGRWCTNWRSTSCPGPSSSCRTTPSPPT